MTDPAPDSGRPQSDFAAQAQQLTEQIKSLQATVREFGDLARHIQTVIAFDHPDLAQMDDELDILYRGQL